MNSFSDFIPILIAVAFGVYQFFRFINKGNSDSSQKPRSTPPPTDPFGGGGKPGESWDDLMEALGQKPKAQSSGPIRPPAPPPRIEPVVPKSQASIPPPVPRDFSRTIPPRANIPTPRIPAPRLPSPSVLVEEAPATFEYYQPKIAEASALKFKSFDEVNIPAGTPGLSTPVLPSLQASRFRQFFSDRERLREAIVLREILDKPVALR